MNIAIVNVKVHPKVKKEAQTIAQELGFSLSALINAYLRQLIKTRSISFSTDVPTKYLLRSLEASEKDIRAGRVVSFRNTQDTLTYLDNLVKDEKTKRAVSSQIFKKV